MPRIARVLASKGLGGYYFDDLLAITKHPETQQSWITPIADAAAC